MKKLIIVGVTIVLYTNILNAQSNYKSNGANNLQSICDDPEECIYVAIPSIIKFPEYGDEKLHWQLFDMEMAAKKSTGHFIATGDMAILGIDTAAIMSFEILFYDKEDKLIYTKRISEYEFYNEPHHAEPIMVAEILKPDIAENVQYISINFLESRLIPYYEMKSNCYYACKNHKLNQEIHTFKKAK